MGLQIVTMVTNQTILGLFLKTNFPFNESHTLKVDFSSTYLSWGLGFRNTVGVKFESISKGPL